MGSCEVEAICDEAAELAPREKARMPRYILTRRCECDEEEVVEEAAAIVFRLTL